MFEPRGTFHTVTLLTINQQSNNSIHNENRKRRKRRHKPPPQPQQQQQQYDVEDESPIYEQHYHDEPETPIHPALEFEIQTTELRKESVTIQNNNTNDIQQQQQQQQPWNTTIETPLLLLSFYNKNDVSNTGNNSSGTSSNHSSSTICTTTQRQDFYYYWCCIFGIVISSIGSIITLKLQAIYMYNYPNFMNVYTNLLYIPFYYAYIIPIMMMSSLSSSSSSSYSKTFNITAMTTTTNILDVPWWSSNSKSFFIMMIVIGTLDAITSTIQTFAAVYLPGSLLVVIPQVTIPVSMILTYFSCNNTDTGIIVNNTSSHYNGYSKLSTTQALGGIIVFIGIIIILVPIWSNQRAPDYYCEATDTYNDCTNCQIATTEMECLTTASSSTHYSSSNITDLATSISSQWLFNTSSTDDSRHDNHPIDSPPCKWLPFVESTKEKESLQLLWSIILMFSSIPMALSAMYKQRMIHTLSIETAATQNVQTPHSMTPNVAHLETAVTPSSPIMYMSGWIAAFQLLVSLLLSIPAGMLSSPSVPPWKLPENLMNGLLCYAGYPVIVNGCHPDTMCTSYHAALWINIGVVCHVIYAVSVLVLLQSSNSCVPLFLALTATVPLGHLAFSLFLLPISSQENVHVLDLIGVLVIVAGLGMYRFTNGTTTSLFRSRRHLPPSELLDEDEESTLSVDGTIKLLSQQIQSSISSLWMQVGNQTSYTLLRESLDPVNNGSV